MRNFEAHTPQIRRQMLKDIGISSMEELFETIPDILKVNKLNLESPISELEAQKRISEISKKNKTSYISFLGGGAVRKFIPSAIGDVASRFEFLSAYTPYQPEISQGTLQIMYEFQTMMCELTGMDVSNASVYDGAAACAEACLMAVRINKLKKIFVSNALNPNYIEVIKTYLWAQDIECVIAQDPPDEEFAGKIYSYPQYDGELVKMPEKKGRELIIACVDLSILPCIEPPCADIIAGDYQPFGIPLNFGGAYGGFIATKNMYMRQLPGRIAGKTFDKEGNPAYVLTLQAREQHIRRNKATGNICSNQALTALCAGLYLSLIGKTGLIEFALVSHEYALKLSKGLEVLGFKILNKNFFNSFTLEMKNKMSAGEFLDILKNKGILGGIKYGDKVIVTTSEYNDDNEISLYLSAFC
ncbi:MAG: aminomethyl-transferring glycine dehydrogenase subunit GcvPA [Candidatus Gastranaerophilales bacterium]|nr:aminomethyl-transferring glycine dehydrogenase subunit GcvPA [Candidatus Gastranaerophilales bacterium]